MREALPPSNQHLRRLRWRESVYVFLYCLTPYAAWRARYYAFRNASRAIVRGDADAAAVEINGPHAAYVRERLTSLVDDNGRIALALGNAAPRVRETPSPSNQASNARALAESLEDRLRFVGIDGYTPTPHGIAARMVQLAAIMHGERVLEPSAGSGRLVEAVLAATPFANVDVCELAIAAREVLVVKQRYLTFSLIGSNFLHLATSPTFDAILMHPPAAEAAAHVLKAFQLHLRRGGRMVAIVPDQAVFAGDRAAQMLRNTIDTHADEPDGELIVGGIGDPPTIPSRLYVLRKPD